MIERIIVAGGGTGGHLFPGLAVVEELRRRVPSLDVLWVGTERGIEARVLPGLGERLELVDVLPLRGKGAGGIVRGLGALPRALARAAEIVRAHRPDVVVGVGGYASGPLLAAAAMLGVPCAILEQNATVGLTNRMLGPIVGRAYVTFDETATRFRKARVRSLGNPIRRAFVVAARRAAMDPEGFEARARRLLVLGGSQGSKALNEIVPEALARAGLRERGVTVLHQTGAAMRDEVAARYASLGVDAEVTVFIDDVAAAYASAALVVARAGATTVAELCAIGRPAILVPFPHAAGDHQGKNAEALARAGAAICLREDALSSDVLGTEVRSLLDDGARRAEMAGAARALGRPDAAAAIVDDLCAWLGCASDDGAGDEGDDGDEHGAADADADDGGPVKVSPARRGTVPYVPRFLERSGRRRASLPPHRRPLVPVLGD